MINQQEQDNDHVVSLSTEETNLIDNTSHLEIVPPHRYPAGILFFGIMIVLIFLMKFVTSCIWDVPKHFEVYKKIQAIRELKRNKEYTKALRFHDELCKAYPTNYSCYYGIKIAKICFKCSENDTLFFKKGLYHLLDKKLNERQFSKLRQNVPIYLRGQYDDLFDIYYRERNQKKEYQFLLNEDRVKVL